MPHNRTVALRTRRLALLLAAASLLITQSVTSAAHDDDEFVWPPDDLVVPLDLKNFDSLVGNGSAWVVEFYAPWCKHCQALQPVLEASARQLLNEQSQSARRSDGDNSRVETCFGKVDATSAAGMFLGMRFFIGGFPHIMLINEDLEVRDYEQIKGSRTQAAITAWVKSGHQNTNPKGFGFGFPGFEDNLVSFSPMSPWWRALYGGLGKGIDLHEKGEVPLHIMGMAVVMTLLTVGSLLIGCCLFANGNAEAGTEYAGTLAPVTGAGAAYDGNRPHLSQETPSNNAAIGAGRPTAPGVGSVCVADQELLKYAVD